MIRTIPMRDKERDFHGVSNFSNFDKLGSQLSRSTLSFPKTTSKTFIFLTHVKPKIHHVYFSKTQAIWLQFWRDLI